MGVARAQTNVEQQLDRIEAKLDEVLDKKTAKKKDKDPQ